MSVACPYERFGCVVLVTAEELEHHLLESAAQHLLLLESKFRSIEEENRRLSHALQAAQTRSRKIDHIRVELIHENELLRKDLLSYSNPKKPVEVKEAAEHAVPIEGFRSADQPEAPLSMPLPVNLPIPIPVSSPSSKSHAAPSAASIPMSLPPALVAANLPEEVIEKLTHENHALRSEVDELKLRLQIREEEALMAEEDGDLSSLDPMQRLQLSQFHRNRHGSAPPSANQRFPGGLFFRSFGVGSGGGAAAAISSASAAQAASSRAIMGRRMGAQDDEHHQQAQVEANDQEDGDAAQELSQEEEREMYLQRIKHYHSLYRDSYLELLRVEGILDETGYHPPPEDQSRPVHFGASAQRGGLRSLLCPVTWVEKIVDTVQHVSGFK